MTGRAEKKVKNKANGEMHNMSSDEDLSQKSPGTRPGNEPKIASAPSDRGKMRWRW